MVINMKSETPLACNMDVFTTAQREQHIQATRELFQTVQNIREAENGFEFTLPGGSDLIKIGEFVHNERRCCPFLKFTLTIDPEPKPITLLLSGPQGTQEFLREEFSEAFT
jgi:hypothetical protein